MRQSNFAKANGKQVATSFAAALMSLIMSAPYAIAQEEAKDDPAFVSLTVGQFDAVQQDDTAAEVRLEYKSDYKLWYFKPFVGAMFTTDQAFHAYTGVLVDFYFGRRLVVTPSFAPGYWSDGDGKPLGNDLEFRSQIEVAYRFDDRSRIGISLNHISNANIGAKNPGTETIAVTYSVPLTYFFGE